MKPLLLALMMSMAATDRLLPQTSDSITSKNGRVEPIKVHGQSLEGNLEGDSPDRDVSIYLPPQYDSNRSLRFPVVYLLHG